MSDSPTGTRAVPAGHPAIKERAPAKINLFLHVGQRRADGFHPLQSLAVFTDLGDELAIEQADALLLTVQGPFAGALTDKDDNLVLRAAQALMEKAPKPAFGARLCLTKNLPIASGIGGGSADAAASLRGLVRFWGLTIDQSMVQDIAARLGSDVPVCVGSAPAFMEGRGEILREVPSLPRMPILLVNPGVAVPTKDVFAALTHHSGVAMDLPRAGFHDTADLLRFLETTRNDLEAPACALQPTIGEVLDALRALPGALFVRMSGSGASCFGLFADEDCWRRGAEIVKEAQPHWWVATGMVAESGIDHEIVGRDFGPSASGL